MRIGYPCKNLSLGATARTFRLASYSEERLRTTVQQNIDDLFKMLEFNIANGLLNFRISSDLVPFASHPVCTLNWQDEFARQLAEFGRQAAAAGMRLSLHPGQYVLLNSPSATVVQSSVDELLYHCQLLDLMQAPLDAKVQIHVGGVYGDKKMAIGRFVQSYKDLPEQIRRRLAIENDERLFSLADCLQVHAATNIPIIFDIFHHSILNAGESTAEALKLASSTWSSKDGPLMIDYSSQDTEKQVGAHTVSIDEADFGQFLQQARQLECDIMLEIKDKEASALKAVALARSAGIL